MKSNFDQYTHTRRKEKHQTAAYECKAAAKRKGRKQLRFFIDFKAAAKRRGLKELQNSYFQRAAKIEFLPDFGKAASVIKNIL